MNIIWRSSDWSRGMILLLGRRGHGFNPRIGPFIYLIIHELLMWFALLAQW
jgi:hypothetical protein